MVNCLLETLNIFDGSHQCQNTKHCSLCKKHTSTIWLSNRSIKTEYHSELESLDISLQLPEVEN